MIMVSACYHKLRGNWLSWYGHFMRTKEDHVVRKVLEMNVDGYRERGRLKKRWMNCVKDDMAAKSVTCEATSDRNMWKKRTCCADHK
ncbi:unnamed protein product [Chrysodeixis includens]|uniref:Uncharacterized protein n=1 Tax=Chrysodeixis includens TaxID=689277 RepID=A0A9N8KY19_CHRIL|nr:unnamed protein product [Chrysodeixis includens]